MLTRVALITGATTAALVAVVAAVHAQSAPSPNEEALGKKLMSEIQSGVACSVEVITLQRRLAEMEAKLKAAEKPAESKK